MIGQQTKYMKTILEFIATKKPKTDAKTPVFTVYKTPDDEVSIYGRSLISHFVAIENLDEWKKLCEVCPYMQQVPNGILYNYYLYISGGKKMLIAPLKKDDGVARITWRDYSNINSNHYKAVDTMLYTDFGWDYWKQNNWV